MFELYQDKRYEWRWRFKDANGKILFVSSEGYDLERDAEQSIARAQGSAGAVIKRIVRPRS